LKFKKKKNGKNISLQVILKILKVNPKQFSNQKDYGFGALLQKE